VIDSEKFIDESAALGNRFFTGVPCSLLKPLLNRVIQSPDLQYVAAANEGEAAAIAAGSCLAGRPAAVMLQNSGLGNIVNPVTSLLNIYKIPLLFIVSQRGQPGINDAVQHSIMGRITESLLDVIGVQYQRFPKKENEIKERLESIFSYMAKEKMPAALVLRKGDVAPFDFVPVKQKRSTAEGEVHTRGDLSEDTNLLRKDAISVVADSLNGTELVVSTTGKISRELFYLLDRPGNFYMQGSMGCAAGIGLGLALNQNKKVVVLDGDGAVIMKMGTLATVGYYQPKHFLHIVLDNESYDSTGGQPSSSPEVSFVDIATACSYRRAAFVNRAEDLEEFINRFKNEEGPSLIHVKVKKGADKNLGRPTIPPEQIKERFMNFVKE